MKMSAFKGRADLRRRRADNPVTEIFRAFHWSGSDGTASVLRRGRRVPFRSEPYGREVSGIGPRRKGGPLCCQRNASSGLVIQR
jgi:hypothetical protein